MTLGIIGQRFHRLLVVSDAGTRGPNYHRYLKCRCDCGKTSVVRQDGLKANRVWSCGCYQLERFKTHPHNLKHGDAKNPGPSPEYRTWQGMKRRCLNTALPDYPDYGGRGITVAPEWISSFPAFLSHIGRRPSAKHSINRINNDGNYEPGNVEWSTSVEQANNRRKRKPRTASRTPLQRRSDACAQPSLVNRSNTP